MRVLIDGSKTIKFAREKMAIRKSESLLAEAYAPHLCSGGVIADSRGGKFMRRFFHHWFRRDTVVRALKIAGVVGPILTLINQYDLLLSGEFTSRLFFKIFLTFLVPYSVSSFSSARAYMESEARGYRSREGCVDSAPPS